MKSLKFASGSHKMKLRTQRLRPFLWLALFLPVILSAPDVAAQTVKVYVSSSAGDRLTSKPDLQFVDGVPASTGTFTISETTKYQTMAGFGASIMEGGIITLNTLPPDKQEDVLRALFDPQTGAGFTAMKTPIAGTDFQSAGPWYTYDDTPGDVEMKNFSVDRDFGPNGVGTYILRARKYGQFALQSPMDYPPDWMLFDAKKRQDVDPKYYPALAKYYVRYLEEYKKHGIVIDYLSLFNEPEKVYTKIKYPEIRVLLRDFVGPTLQNSGLTTKIMLSEAPERGHAYARYPVVLDDPVAKKFVAVMPYHGYDFKNYDKIAKLHAKYPDLPLWMDEVCYAYEAGYPRSKKLPIYDFDDGDFWGNVIFSDLEAGASAWIYWNAILDEAGGPWAVSPIHGNPDPNEQHPVVIINKKTHEVSYTGLYYYLTHFSKFVRPGAVRVETSGALKGVRVMTFQSDERSYVTHLMNSSAAQQGVYLVLAGRTVHVNLPARSITTLTW
jgi:glucosylceramidase